MPLSPYPGDLTSHLCSLVVLADHVRTAPVGAFERAARDLSVDVSVLRRRLQTLAHWFGSSLVEGRRGTLRLTGAGARVLASASSMLSDLDSLRAEVSGLRPVLAIACPSTVASDVLAVPLRSTLDRWPMLPVRVRDCTTERGLELLQRGEAGLAVLRSNDSPAIVASRHLAPERIWLVAAPTHPLARRTGVTIDDIRQHTVIVPTAEADVHRRVARRLRSRGCVPQLEADNRTEALRYVEQGLGVAIVAGLRRRALGAFGSMVRDVTEQFEPEHLWVGWNRRLGLRIEGAFLVEQLVAETRDNASS